MTPFNLIPFNLVPFNLVPFNLVAAVVAFLFSSTLASFLLKLNNKNPLNMFTENWNIEESKFQASFETLISLQVPITECLYLIDTQCGQIGRFLQVLGNKLSYKSILVTFRAISNNITFM